MSRGVVYLIGAGPGDPGLITVRGRELLSRCDVVLYDALAHPSLLEHTREGAELRFVGKRGGQYETPQAEINDALVSLAKEGKIVGRLKGGDPLLFARGAEEALALAEHGVRFEIVPGISSPVAASAYAGIPLTHRDHAQSCLFVTGHRKEDGFDMDWHALTRPRQTVVVYMGLLGLAALCDGMVAHGMSGDTPAAVIQQGTTREQRVVTGTLSTLAQRVAAAKLTPPTLMIVGDVVRLREKLAWFRPEDVE